MITLKEENWKYCDLCDTITYITQCECKSSLCNGGGCHKCELILAEAENALWTGNTPFNDKKKVDTAKNKSKMDRLREIFKTE